MKVNSGTIIGILGALLALIVILVQYCNPKPNPNVYPRDTILVEKPVIHRDTVFIETKTEKPIYTQKFGKDTVYLVNNLIDTIVIPGPEVYKSFPSIISGEFQEDHMKLITRDTTGHIYSNVWLYNWVKNSAYHYDGYSGNLLAIEKGTGDLSDDFGNGPPISQVPKLKGFESNAYLLYGTQRNFMLRGDASLNYKKFGLYLYGQLNTALPNAEAGFGLKYRLK